MDIKVKATANQYDLYFLVHNSVKCRRPGQQVDKIPISQFVWHSFKHTFCKLCSKREKTDKN